MNISLCTISFRHHLLSLEQIAHWASRNGFQGIEIWGAHARHIPFASGYDARWLAEFGLHVPMISDYLPLDRPDTLDRKTVAALDQANRWGADNIRTFAGKTASGKSSPEARAEITKALRRACRQIGEQGKWLLVETHPGTLADSLESTVQLIEQVDHPALAINFDALHIWEGGDDPVIARKVLLPKIRNYHLKNISDKSLLPVFAPGNIYDAAGTRQGIVPLFEGQMPYGGLIAEIADETEANLSLEWFGDNVFQTLEHDRAALVSQLSSAGTLRDISDEPLLSSIGLFPR
ncbi:MAG: sugar phosphate isomerase/epimerase family protein [Pseudomonadota bacterium]